MTANDPNGYMPDLAKPPAKGGPRHGGRSWMMFAMCVPMLILAVVLVVTGVVGFGFVFVAIACTAMMALMMRGMGGSGRR